MPQPIDVNVQRLASLTGYLEFILSKFPAPEGDEQEDPLILILVCMQKTLERRISKTRPTVEWVRIMKWSVIKANKLIDAIYAQDGSMADWNPMSTPQNMVQNTAAMLMDIQHELIGDVAQGEDYLKNELRVAAEDYAKEIFAAYEAAIVAGEIEAEDAPAEIAKEAEENGTKPKEHSGKHRD
jgi:hypothetical protein